MTISTPKELFASYSQVNGNAPVINVLEDRVALELTRVSARIFKRHTSILNNDSARGDDPILTILCITDNRLQPGRPQVISQQVIDWLMDNGHMEKRF